jgi:hypothetical protein
MTKLSKDFTRAILDINQPRLLSLQARTYKEKHKEEKKVYLAWQDTINRSWYPVGILTANQEGTFRFVYT